MRKIFLREQSCAQRHDEHPGPLPERTKSDQRESGLGAPADAAERGVIAETARRYDPEHPDQEDG